MTSTRSEFEELARIYVPIGVAVFVVIVGTILFLVWRGSRRERPTGAASHAPRVEAAYVAVLVAVAAGLSFLSLRVLDRVDAEAADPALTVEVTAFQWGWRFTYGSSGVTTVGDQDAPPLLRVPADRTVRFELRTRDVIHSFWVPEQRFKRDAIPGRTNSFDLLFDEPGMNGGKCAEYCGLRHTAMDFNVLALEPESFDQWLREQRQRARAG